MRNVSNEWLAAISTGRDYSIDEKKRGCAVPITPWLHPPVGKMDFFEINVEKISNFR